MPVSLVMPALDPGIQSEGQARVYAWIAGSSRAMTVKQVNASVHQLLAVPVDLLLVGVRRLIDGLLGVVPADQPV
jgi:hypothetical protein